MSMAPTGASLKALSDPPIQVLTFDRRVPVHEVVTHIKWQLGKGFSFLAAVALQAPCHLTRPHPHAQMLKEQPSQHPAPSQFL